MALLPKVKLKTVVSFPAAVFGGSGIAVRQVNGQFFFDLNFSAFMPPVVIPSADMPSTNVLTYNAVSGVYKLSAYSGGSTGLADAPSDGSLYGRLNATWTKALPLAGGTLTGSLTLNADPATALGAATKQYVDGHAGGLADAPSDGSLYGRLNAAWVKGLPLAGGTLTGALTLAANPTVALGAATKQYVDGLAGVVSIGGQTGAITLNGGALAGTILTTPRYDVAQTLTGPQQIQTRANIAAIGAVRRQIFTASGTYTPSAGMLYCIMETLGGGGAGGGAASVAGSNHAGGGGGAGSLSILYANAAAVGASQVVTIGAGGAGVSGAAGGNGGNTTIGAICGGVGGFGGQAGVSASTFGTPGAGGTAGTGDITGTGMPGGGGSIGSTAIYGPSGMGGSTIYGGGGPSLITGGTTPGNPGTGRGSGGSGGFSYNAATPAAGGNGMPGIAIITEFCNQ